MEFVIKVKGLGPLTLGKLCHRDSCPLGNDTCYLLIGNLLPYQLILIGLGILCFLQLSLQFR